VHKSKWQVKQFLNLFFMNAIAKKQRSFSTVPRTWTHAISISFMNSKNLCLRMEEKLILEHNWVTWFIRQSLLITTSLFAINFILKKDHYTSKTWPSRTTFTITPYVPILQGIEYVGLMTVKCWWKTFSNLLGWSTQKLG